MGHMWKLSWVTILDGFQICFQKIKLTKIAYGARFAVISKYTSGVVGRWVGTTWGCYSIIKITTTAGLRYRGHNNTSKPTRICDMVEKFEYNIVYIGVNTNQL